MALNIDIQSSIKREEAFWRAVPRFAERAARESLTALAYEARDDGRVGIKADIDRPNPFTRNALAVVPARVGKLESAVFVKPLQAEYLQRLVSTGVKVRNPIRRSIFIPSRSNRRDAFGNMSRARRRSVLSNSNLIVIDKGNYSVGFLRKGKSIEFVGAFMPRTVYPRQYWKFYERASLTYTQKFPGIYARKINKLIRSSR